MKKLFIFMMTLVTTISLASCQSDAEAYDFVTTMFPQYDIAVSLAGDDFTVFNVLPLGASPHSYEVTSQDIETMTLSKTLIYTSDTIEPWVLDLNLGDTTIVNLLHEVEKVVTFDFIDTHEHEDEHVDDHEDDHEGVDPHYWTHPLALLEMVEVIAKQMIDMKPELETTILSRSQSLKESFEAEFKLLSDALESFYLSEPKIYVAGHNAVAYYAHYFDIHVESLFVDFVPDAELTSAQLDTFMNIIKNDQVSYFFIEPLFDAQPLAANTIVDGLSNDGYTIQYEELYQFHNIGQNELENEETLLTLLAHNRTKILISLEENRDTR